MLPHIHNDAEACVEAVLSQVGRKIVLAMPIAIGKPNHFVNALYRRAVQDKSISLKIFTALSFVKPTLKSDLERRFAGPLIQRLFGQFPDLEYAASLQRGQLPPNIEVHDFFFQAGAFLNSPLAQQGYTSLNYTYATKHVMTLGVNVFGHCPAAADPHDHCSHGGRPHPDGDGDGRWSCEPLQHRSCHRLRTDSGDAFHTVRSANGLHLYWRRSSPRDDRST